MAMTDAFAAYLKKLRETPLDQQTEHTGRAALEALLGHFAGAAKQSLKVQHEPKREVARGAPDFKIHRPGQILGYVEVKGIGENLDKVLKSEQIAKYRKLSQNIILTDYLEFFWLDGKDVKARARLIHAHELEARKLNFAQDKASDVAKLLQGFFSEAPEGIGRSQQLALALATRSQLLRDYLMEELIRQEKDHTKGRLFGLYEVFKAQIFHELTLKEFADAFAQMLAYGLFLAKLNAGAADKVTLSNARDFVPASFRLIRELVDFLAVLNQSEYRDIRWVVEEVLSIVNALDLEKIHADLSFRKRKAISRKIRAGDEEEHRLFERDPFIYFYEDYLKAYDKETRKGRGVYYTPPPVVNFIVRAVDDILKDTFGIDDGLADHKRVTVLDFACGTGTFLLEAFEKIFENIGGADSGKAALIVREHLLKNLYGFEYLIAPYTIAHLKLSQYLRDRGHPLTEDQRLQVFLTNTLEPISPQSNFLLPAVTAEVEAAQEVKNKPILVIMGNPPYSGHSKNKGAWITGAIAKYREGFPDLSKPAQGKWLQDDYVKFIRFAQMKMDAVDEGIVGIITNHSWLDNPTFKGMRKSLMETFNQIYILDLHGNAKKKERAPDGGPDQNVFDIEQGVAVSLFVKRKTAPRVIHHSDVWGVRLHKYHALSDLRINDIKSTQINPKQPDWLCRPQDEELVAVWRSFPSVPEIFSVLGDPAPGVVTTHDEFAISFTKNEAIGKVKSLLATRSEQEARVLFRLCSQDQWSYDRAKSELPMIDFNSAAKMITYRPFDNRWTIWDRNVAVHRRERATAHMFNSNLALLTARSNKSPDPNHFFVTDLPSETKAAESTIQSYILPLFTYEGAQRAENLSPAFRDFLDARYDHHYEPEDILGYIYAVLHAPAYRSRYAEFLRIDFPRIPFPEARADFDALSALGWALVQVHLLRVKPKLKLARFLGKGNEEVEAIRYSPEEKAVHINKTQWFAPVQAEVWEFHIGGYQVLQKYLKSRKGRTLSLDEIDHLGHVADALAFTIRQMEAIGEAYAQAFPGRG
jgi:predicted helicase